MNPIIATIKASRWQNLLLITLTMCLVRYGIIQPFFKILVEDSPFQFAVGMGNLDFGLLILSSVLIAAAGNLINDYFDIKIDRVNKPDAIIVGRHIKRRVAMLLHVVFNVLALLIAVYLSIKAGKIELVFIHVIIITTLWFYSTDFKKRLIYGNLSIAFCVALIPIVVWVFEVLTLITVNFEAFKEIQAKTVFKEFSVVTLSWVVGLSIFSFIVTLAREITKDIVDIKGDLAFRCKSLPIVFGIKTTKIIIVVLDAIVIGLVVYVQQVYLPGDRNTSIYFYLLIVPSLLITAFFTLKAKEPSQFKLPAGLNKIASLIGVLFLVVVYFILKQP
jgi:4-hydroxybenzoate polyprenyltransferase